VKEPLSLFLSRSSGQHFICQIKYRGHREETTENKQHLNETTEKTNNIKQNNTKESLHLLIWATFYVPNLLLFIERESRDNREREREKK